MEFQKYPSILNRDFVWSINKEYVIQEKIHGCNFSFWVDSAGVRCGSRNRFLDDSNNFFGFQCVKQALLESLVNLREDLGKDVVVYGELYGNKYDGVAGFCKPSQSTIQYFHEPFFRAFDILVDSVFLDFDDAQSLLNSHGIPVIPVLHRGSFESCRSQPREFLTTIPALHGLSDIADNFAEGFVLRPVLEERKRDTRLIWKMRHSKFLEQWKQKNSRESCPHEEMYDIAETYVNENRLNNVLSHMTEEERKDFPLVLKAFREDVLQEMFDNHKEFGEKVRRAMPMKEMAGLVRQMLE